MFIGEYTVFSIPIAYIFNVLIEIRSVGLITEVSQKMRDEAIDVTQKERRSNFSLTKKREEAAAV